MFLANQTNGYIASGFANALTYRLIIGRYNLAPACVKVTFALACSPPRLAVTCATPGVADAVNGAMATPLASVWAEPLMDPSELIKLTT